jgi:hypothetical protein
MNLGDVAQKAAVSYLIETAYATATTYDAADPMTALYDLVSGAPSPIPSTAAFTDPFTTTPGWLQTIFDDSGAALPAL